MIWTIIDYLFFIIFAINVLYLLLFASLSLLRLKQPKPSAAKPSRRIAVLIPAYKEDGVIMECARSALAQRYPQELVDVVVISDSMTDATNERLAQLPLKLIVVNFDKSTKAKALNTAMHEIGDDYDVAGFSVGIVDEEKIIDGKKLAIMPCRLTAPPKTQTPTLPRSMR